VNKFRTVATALIAAAALAGSAHATTAPAKKTFKPTKGVVLVTTNLAYEGANAAGTGIVLTSNGEILTNNHVISGATTITVTVPSNGRHYPAQVLGYDISDDVALLKLDGASGLATATRANSSKLKVGATTTAVGNANGGGRLVITKGHVTALGRTITVNDENAEGGQRVMSGLIETSARLVPGDSGGPLLDARGHVIGIDAAGSASTFRTADGYAIPINKAVTLVRQMEAGKPSALVHIGKTAFIGLSVQENGSGGLEILDIVPNMPAANAGLVTGETVLSVDGVTTETVDALRNILFGHHPGDSIAITYLDQFGQQQTATIVLADGPPQ